MLRAFREVRVVLAQLHDLQRGKRLAQHRLGVEVLDVLRPAGLVLVLLRRVADEQEQPAIGANRWVNRTGMVLEAIDVDAATGMVRIDGGEEWRATSDTGAIASGTRVVVTEVRGTRLVVVPEAKMD